MNGRRGQGRVLRKEVYVFYGTRAKEKDLATLLALGSLRGLGLGSLGGSNLLALSALGRSGGSLLLEVLLLLLPFLDLLEGSLLSGSTDLRPLSALLLDLVEGGTDDVPLYLHDLPGLLLLDLGGGALLVDAPVHGRPEHLAGVALLEESLLGLGVDEDEGLHVGTGIATAMTRVDLVPGELADFSLHFVPH